MLISCHNKTGNSKSTVNLEYENSIDSLNSYKMDISHFINSIEPGETIVEEKQMQGEEFITRENENIKVRFVLKAPCSKDGFLKTEITNNTNDTIIYISNTFLQYRESNNSWIPLVYQDNYVKNDLGYLIPPHESVKIRFFLPSQEELRERLSYINNYEDFVSPSQIQSLPILPVVFVFIPIFAY